MYRRLSFLIFFAIFFLGCQPAAYRQYNVKDIKERWDADIAAFDALNNAGLPDEPVLFYGSSSFRLWESLAVDMAPLAVVNRGFGGATLHDGAFYAKRVLAPVDYQALVLFFANDIYGNKNDKTPEEMEVLVDHIVKTSQKLRPEAVIYLLEITQTPMRKNLIAEWDAANAMLAQYAQQHDAVVFIPTRDLFVTAEETTKPSLFRGDGLHLNAEGYDLWRERVRQYLFAASAIER